ncbi:MAG: hypothetical protein AAF664_20385 [Planctomycetota bacterium]
MSKDTKPKPIKRRFLDFRCFATSTLALVLGMMMWKVQSLISGNATFDPNFVSQLGWFTACGFATGVCDPRSPWLNWLSLYTGAYLFALPFFPSDPLIPLALVFGIIFTGFCVFIGTLIPTTIAFAIPLHSPASRRWAGYHD